MKALLYKIKTWIRQQRKLIALSVLTSTVIIIFTYVMGNIGYPLPGETGALKQITDYKRFLGMQIDNVPDSILLINICYDKALVPYQENGIPVGKTVITDREKLLQFLTKAKKANNYRYIFLDIFFEEGSNKKIIGLAFTIIYAIVLITLNILDIISGPYPFLKVKEQAISMTIMWGGLILLGSYLVGQILYQLNKKKGAKN